jgi:hypothetical protein
MLSPVCLRGTCPLLAACACWRRHPNDSAALSRHRIALALCASFPCVCHAWLMCHHHIYEKNTRKIRRVVFCSHLYAVGVRASLIISHIISFSDLSFGCISHDVILTNCSRTPRHDSAAAARCTPILWAQRQKATAFDSMPRHRAHDNTRNRTSAHKTISSISPHLGAVSRCGCYRLLPSNPLSCHAAPSGAAVSLSPSGARSRAGRAVAALLNEA